MLAAAYFIYPGSQVNADSHLFLSVSIVDRGALNIDPFARPMMDMSAWHGHYYSDKAPGLSLLAVPFYMLAKLLLLHGRTYVAVPAMDVWVRYVLSVALAAVPTGAIAWLLYTMFERMGLRRGWCAALSLTYGLGTIARPFASQFFSHQLSALLCFGAFVLAFGLRREQLAGRFALLAGFLLGLAFITEYPSAIVAVAIAAYVVTIPKRGLSLALAMCTAAIPPLAIGALYNTVCFGGPLRIGYANLAGPDALRLGQAQGFFGVTYPHLEAIWGITFSPYRGLFFLSPVLLLAIPACALLVRRVSWRAEAMLCAWTIGGFLLFGVSYFAWTGGASMGPRQVLISLPFFVLPIGELVRPERAPQWGRVVATLSVYSIALVELCAAVGSIFDESLISPVTQWVLPRLAGMRVDLGHPNRTHGRLVGALLHQMPGFLGAKLEYNWGQAAHLPGLIQLYPLLLVSVLLLLGPTLREYIVPRARPLILPLAARVLPVHRPGKHSREPAGTDSGACA
jgi:hypothetical protein